MKILISGNENIRENYKNAVEHFGVTAVFSNDFNEINSCDALILSGGGDVHPSFYNQENFYCSDIDYNKDLQEFNLIKHFSENNKPILGICRGIQILNVAFGGSLIQNLPNLKIHSRLGENQDKNHFINIKKHNFLYPLYSTKVLVNSAHHQAIDTLAKDFKACAMSEDGIIEAISHTNKPIFAVQFHPERMMSIYNEQYCGKGDDLFRYFIGLI